MAPDTQFHRHRHIKYWRRCLKTVLPNAYTSTDSNRMLLAFFIVSALDVLGDLDDALSVQERQGYIDWVYNCQLLEGGFRPWPGSAFGRLRNEENKTWDPAHMAGTFFALLILVVLRDDLARAKRREILEWLVKMQRPEGSFGETLGEDGRLHGGNDSRFGYMAAAIRWILGGHLQGPYQGVPDINTDSFVICTRQAECYDGGISEAPFHEAHGGFTACAIAALYFLDRLPLQPPSQPSDGLLRGVTNVQETLHWLVSRQTTNIDDDDPELYNNEADMTGAREGRPSFMDLGAHPLIQTSQEAEDQLPNDSGLQWVGMNGRCNKIGDTCYAYWTCCPLQLLGHLDLIDQAPIRRWLLDKTQHIVGGFGKLPGDPPDLNHSFLGLMTLAMFDEPGLQSVDAPLCITKKAREHLESLPWRKQMQLRQASSGACQHATGSENSQTNE